MGDRVVPANSDDAETARIAELASQWAAAIVSNDPERIGAFMALDWVMVSESGISGKAEFLAAVESGGLSHSAMRPISTPRIRRYAGTAVFTARVTNTAHFDGRRFDADEWTTDVFVQRDGRWRCVLSHITAAAAD